MIVPSSGGVNKPRSRGTTAKGRAGRLAAQRRELRKAQGLAAARCGGLCERCGDPLTFGVEFQHRQARGMGGSGAERAVDVRNLLALCVPPGRACHAHVEAHRVEAVENGWAVSRWGDYTTQPVLYRGRWVLLTSDGKTLDMPAEQV